MRSASLYGLRISLTVGLAAVALATLIGSLIGLIAAYVGGFVDTVLMRIVDFILGFPTILVALVLLAMLGRGVDKVVIAIVVVQWAHYARIMRSRALQERMVDTPTNIMGADGIETLLAVSHGSASRQFIKAAAPEGFELPAKLPNCAIMIFDFDEANPQAEGEPMQCKFTLQQIVDPQQSN